MRGFVGFVSAKLEKGIDLVLGLLGAKSYIQQADLVIVGEGRLDSQSANGKAPVGVARMASHYDVPVIALCGDIVKIAVSYTNMALLQCGHFAPGRFP